MPNEGKAELWSRLEADVIKEMASAELVSDVSIRFRAIELTETALILFTSEQPQPVQRVRDRLNALVAAAGLPAQAFDRTHVTLARPCDDEFLDAATVAALERVPPVIDIRVRAMNLVRESIYPSLEVELIA